jgi:hypothetical protein
MRFREQDPVGFHLVAGRGGGGKVVQLTGTRGEGEGAATCTRDASSNASGGLVPGGPVAHGAPPLVEGRSVPYAAAGEEGERVSERGPGRVPRSRGPDRMLDVCRLPAGRARRFVTDPNPEGRRAAATGPNLIPAIQARA